MAVRIGIGLFTGQVPAGSERSWSQEYRETIELVRLAEALGFDSAWVSEHHGASDGYVPSLLVMLAAFAEATSHIRLGTGVILTPLHDPLRLAEDAATVDQLSAGRLVLGLGNAWREEEFRMFGVPIAERKQRTIETIEILRRAWTGRRFSFDGEIYRFDQVRVTPPPARPGGPPILLGGYADAVLRRAGELADGYIGDADDAEYLRRAVRLMDDAARSTGRDPHALTLTLMQNAFVTERGGDAWAIVRDGVRHQLGMYETWEEGADTPARDEAPVPPGDESADRAATPTGTADEVAHALRPTLETFAHERDLELIVRLHYPGMAFDTASRAVELFGERVIPALKGS